MIFDPAWTVFYLRRYSDGRWESLVLLGDWWYKGWGATPEASVAELQDNLASGTHAGKHKKPKWSKAPDTSFIDLTEVQFTL